MSNWRPAKSLVTLREQVNAAWPDRNTDSDGMVGDTRHQQEHSDHNPDDNGVVCAFDITQDPAHGADMSRLSESLRVNRHPALQYLIWNRQISNVDVGNGAWRAYGGSDPHTGHLHVSVKHGAIADNVSGWDLPVPLDVRPQPAPAPAPAPAPSIGDYLVIGPYSVVMDTPDKGGLLKIKPEGSVWTEGSMPAGWPWDFADRLPIVFPGLSKAPITAATWVLSPKGQPVGVIRVAADLSFWPFGQTPPGFPWEYAGPRKLNAPVRRISLSSDSRGATVWTADGGVFKFGDAPAYTQPS